MTFTRTIATLCVCTLLFLLEFCDPATASPLQPRESARCLINHHPEAPDLKGVYYFDHVRTVALPSGTKYRYVHYSPRCHDKPYILFLHGWPDSSYLWRNQFEYFHRLGYGIVAPDLLGFGGSDKPANLSAYFLKNQSRDMINLLDCEGIRSVIGVGHDLGSPVLARLHSYFDSHFKKFAFLDVGYSAPPFPLTKAGIDATNALFLSTKGYEPFGYWAFFNRTGAGHVMDAHMHSLYSLIYTNDTESVKRNFSATGALEAFLKADGQASRDPLLNPADETIHNRVFDPARGGYEPSLNHYRALYRNLNLPDEQGIPKSAYNITKPTLLLTCANDSIVPPVIAENGTRPYAEDLQVQTVESDHWLMLKHANVVNEALRKFFSE